MATDRALTLTIGAISLAVLAAIQLGLTWPLHGARFAPPLATAGVLGLIGWELLDRRAREPVARPVRRFEPYALALLSAALFLGFRDRCQLGDYGRVLFDLRNAIVMLKAEPLGEPVMFPALGIAALVDVPVVEALRVYLALACVPGVLALAVLANRAAPTRRLLVFGAIASSGAIALFFGHIETYPIPTAIMLGMFAATLAALRGERTLRGSIALYGAICLLHLEFLCLLPAVLYAAWLRRRDGGHARDLALFVLLPAVVAQAVCALYPSPYPQFFGGGDETMLVPLREWFSRAHLRAVVDEQLLLSPGALLVAALVVAARPRLLRDPELAFLALAALGWLGFSFVWNPDLGAFDDWDIFGAMGFVLSAFAALVVHRGIGGSSGSRALAMLTLVQLARTLPFCAHNHAQPGP